MKKRFVLPVLLILLIFGALPVSAAPKLSKMTVKIGIEKTYTLKVNGISSGTKVKWSSANKNIATVNSKGKITGISAGKTKITAKVGSKNLRCNVIVVRKNIIAMNKLERYSYFRKYMSESEMTQAYNVAKSLLEPIRGLSRKDQVIQIAVILRRWFDNGMTYTMKLKHYNDPYGYFVLKWGSCAGCARATGMCLNMLGFSYEHVNENQYSHQWARVKVGNEYWICDAYGLYVGKEPAVRKHPYLS